MTRTTRATLPDGQHHPALTGSALNALDAGDLDVGDLDTDALHTSTVDVNALKLVVVGGFGVGKTTMVRSVSEIRPLYTEEVMSREVAPDGQEGGEEESCPDRGGGTRTGLATPKGASTVAFDFGRLTLDDRRILYVFGAPGQERFWFLWDRLLDGTLGAVVLVDTRRLSDAWYALNRLEAHGMPFIVAVNDFGGPLHSDEQIRTALAIGPEIPLVEFDARDHSSSKFVLLALVEHLQSAAAPGKG